MSEHTPGPWSYRNREHDDWGVVRSDDYGFICQAKDPRNAWDQEVLSAHRRTKTDPWGANARLIAAAPELLDALCAAILEHDAGGITLATARDMRVAIAKATSTNAP